MLEPVRAKLRRSHPARSLLAAAYFRCRSSSLASSWEQLPARDARPVTAAAVLGGDSLFGGVGAVIRAIVGELMIALINKGLILLPQEFGQELIPVAE